MDQQTNKQEPSGTEGGQVKNPRVGDWVWVKGQIKNTQFGATETEVEICEQRVYVRIFDCRPVEPQAKQPTQGQRLAEQALKGIWAANDAVSGTPAIEEPLATKPNSSEIPNSSSEPMREAFERSMAERYDWYQGYFSRNEDRYFDSSVEMAWQAFRAGAKYQPSPLAPSPCMDGVDDDRFTEGIMEARGRASDPLQVGDAVRFVSPGHKRHGTKGAVYSKVDLVSSGCNYWFDSNCGQFSCYCTASQLERIDQADPVNPSHYKQGGIECIEAIKAATGEGFTGYVWGNVLKYLWRWPKKGGVEDLKKARWYLDRLIKEVGE